MAADPAAAAVESAVVEFAVAESVVVAADSVVVLGVAVAAPGRVAAVRRGLLDLRGLLLYSLELELRRVRHRLRGLFAVRGKSCAE